MDKLLMDKEATEILGVKPGTLRKRRAFTDKLGEPGIPPFIREGRRVYYLESEILKYKAMGRRRYERTPRKKTGPSKGQPRPAGHVRQTQAAVLLNLPKGILDHDYLNGRTIPVRGNMTKPFYPLDGIKARLAGKPDILLTFTQTVRALDTTKQRLADHVTNVTAGDYTMLELPFEYWSTGAVGFRRSAVIKAAEVLFQHAEE